MRRWLIALVCLVGCADPLSPEGADVQPPPLGGSGDYRIPAGIGLLAESEFSFRGPSTAEFESVSSTDENVVRVEDVSSTQVIVVAGEPGEADLEFTLTEDVRRWDDVLGDYVVDAEEEHTADTTIQVRDADTLHLHVPQGPWFVRGPEARLRYHVSGDGVTLMGTGVPLWRSQDVAIEESSDDDARTVEFVMPGPGNYRVQPLVGGLDPIDVVVGDASSVATDVVVSMEDGPMEVGQTRELSAHAVVDQHNVLGAYPFVSAGPEQICSYIGSEWSGIIIATGVGDCVVTVDWERDEIIRERRIRIAERSEMPGDRD